MTKTVVLVLLVVLPPIFTMIAGYGLAKNEGALSSTPRTPRPEKKPSWLPPWLPFWSAFAAIVSVAVFLFFVLDEAPWQPRLVGIFLMAAPAAYATYLWLRPTRRIRDELKRTILQEIAAPWIVILIFALIADEWLGDLSTELAVMAYIFPWLGAVRIVLSEPWKDS